jgi:hypothetical protein
VKSFLLLVFLSSCATHALKGSPREGKTIYSYVDESGTFSFVRENKSIKQKMVTRSHLIDRKGAESKLLEKTVMVSRIGSIKKQGTRLLTVRPEASEYSVWLEGKKYHSKFEIVPAKKAMKVTLESPEPKWQGVSEVLFPKARYFCFFNQIPECLYHNYLLISATENQAQRFDFYVIWDSYPYIQDVLLKVGRKLFAPASVKFDGEIKGLFRYIVEVEGQAISYQFTKNYELVKVAWISQGITIAPPGQEIAEDE